MNRLTSVIKGENETVYDFDCYNNIEKKYELFLDNKSTTRYHYDSANRLVMSENGTNAVHYEYDDSGNMTKKTDNNGSVRYSYDGFNRLKSVASGENVTEYAYTPEGFRSKKTVNGSTTRYLYDGANICAEVIPDGTAYTYYRADGIIGSVHGDEKLYYSQTSRGDVSVVYDAAGNVVKNNTYSPYGERKTVQKVNDTNDPLRLMWVAETENVHIPFGYCGEYTDDETGFVYLRNRYYDPEVGRFITEDPARDGENWYVYCENNPIMFVDTNGLQPAIAHQFKRWCEDTFIGGILYEETRAGDLDWYYELCGFSRTDDGVFHAKKDAWQQYFGYNDLYDVGFNLGTDMNYSKVNFNVNGENMVIWFWKGDYLNLGAGAEVGIYSGDGFFKKCGTGFEMPMSLKVYNGEEKIIDYQATTWWCTGFNPEYHNVKASDLRVEASINFSSKPEIYDAIYKEYSGRNHMYRNFRFNGETKTVYFYWSGGNYDE